MRSVTRKVVADHLVVSERLRDWLTVSVRQPFLEQLGPFLLDQFPVSVFEHRLEEQEPHPDWPVAILEARDHEAMLHLGHLGAGRDRKFVRRSRIPRRIPDAPQTLAHRMRPKDLRGASGRGDYRLGLEDIDFR